MSGRLRLVRRRIVEVAGGGAGFIASVIDAAISFANRFTLLGGTVAPGVEIDAGRHTFRGPTLLPAIAAELVGATGVALAAQAPGVAATYAPLALAPASVLASPGIAASMTEAIAFTGPIQSPGIGGSLLGASGAAAVATAPGIMAGPRISDWHVDQAPAAEIVRVVYSLTRRVGGNAQAAVGTAWTTPANAVGDRDGTVATVAGSGLGSTNGIELAYANSVAKGELAITAAVLHVYAEVTGDATGLLSDTVISYNIGAGLVQLEAIAGNFANLTTPRDYALPLLDSWAEYDALAARVVQTMAAASVGVTARLDAIEIEITASRTDSL